MQQSCKVIAVANQKGGVGKTTATEHLGIGLARHGKKVLLIDLDSQANLTALLYFQKKIKYMYQTNYSVSRQLWNSRKPNEKK